MILISGKGLVIIGAQFGDEGKGKVVDYYASKPYIHHVIRFNGGANAGHTIVANGNKYALHVVPSGLVFGKSSFIGNGVVLDLEQLDKEIKYINGIQQKDLKPLLKISERVQLVFPFHKLMDTFQEEFKGNKALSSGSTKRGVGPSYSDKINRIGIRFIDLWNTETVLKDKLRVQYEYNAKILGISVSNDDVESLYRSLLELREKFSSNLCDVGFTLENSILSGQNLLFEGAQSTLLDTDHGIYPFNTSSTCIAAGASSGSGIGLQYLNERIGVVKAFVSRVGAGPLMGEISDLQPGKFLQEAGQEYGTTTGRPRRIAWLDIVTLKYSCRVNGFTGLALTKVDILGMLEEFNVIISYKLPFLPKDKDRRVLSSGFPAELRKFSEFQPILKKFKSWGRIDKSTWKNMIEAGYQFLPKELRYFIEFIETECGIPIYLIGFGPERELTYEKTKLNW